MADINGTPGDDIIVGTADADNIDAGAGKDRVNAGNGDDIVHGGDGNDVLLGEADNDILFGDAGNDTLNGGSGDDQLFGGDGNDGFFGGGRDDLIMGEAGNDTMFGDGGNDTMDGGADDDRLFGGSGNDTLIYTVGEGTDELVGNTGVDTVRLVMTSAQFNSARAELVDFYNWLQNEVSQAGGEAAHAGLNTSNEFTFTGFDLKVSALEKIELQVDGLIVPIEDILNQAPTVDAVQALNGTEDTPVSGQVTAQDPDGDALVYTLSEGPTQGQVSLNAQTGEFTYTPGDNYSGNDTFKVTATDPDGASAEQTVNLDIAGVADAPTLTVATSLVGTTINGSSGSDEIVGTLGGDTIDGGAGNDSIKGDPNSGGTYVANLDITADLNDTDGSETLSITISGVPDGALLSAGTDQGNGVWNLAQADLNGLQLTHDGAADINLTVTATATELNGDTSTVSQNISITDPQAGGDDIISGGAGNDRIDGGGGNDTISGDAGNDRINAGDGNDTISGGDGKDNIKGGDGNDAISGGDGKDNIKGGDGNDTISGGDGNDKIKGENGDDTIIAGAGNDAIQGGRGEDTLTGGSGADDFIFAKSDVVSGRRHHGIDTITDFGAEDRLDFTNLLRGVNYNDLSDVVHTTQTNDGTMLSVELNGSAGSTDVVFLDDVFDVDIDLLDAGGQIIV